MADFKAHTSVGTLWGLLLGTVSVISDFCSLIGGIVILFLAATSSAAPDIDSDTDVQENWCFLFWELLFNCSAF